LKPNVRLISYSQPAKDAFIGIDDAQDLIAYCARVSNPSNQSNKKTAERLLSYLAKESHWSPFEMVSACLEIETTRDIARQILRHRSFSFQEFSQRYADPTKDLDMVKREARLQDHTNRQNSIEIENDPAIQLDLKKQDLITEWGRRQHGVINQAKEVYQWAIENGIAKEQARAVLPEGNMMSRIYMNGTIRSWMHYIELRSGNGTQKEHREVALECAKEIEKVFPIIRKFIKK
jgi:thymidylate synthase (FAD)